MTQPRRPDEIALYATLRALRVRVCLGSTVRRAAQELDIPLKRACYLIDKWDRKGWYEMSSCPPGGWFTGTAPEALTP